jgi:carboxyl-terminal processing protease
MPKISKILLLVVSVALVLTVFLGMNSSGVNAASEQDGAYSQINVYTEVLRHIQSDYVVDPNVGKVTDGAMRGLLESLDADSSYLTPEEYKIYKTEKPGSAQVGINVSKRGGYATVVSVVPGSPADKASLNDGDFIEAIGVQDTRDLSLAMIRRLLEGESGSELTISIVRPPKPIPQKITMTRAVVSYPSVSETMYENSSILYLKPEVLDREHVQQIEAKLKGMQKAGNKKVLLDLRDVSAGDMPDAIRLANFLLPSGTIATLAGQKVAKQTFTVDPAKTINAAAPVVVLVNRGTAGPAELTAAALLDNKRAELVGERTFGEGAQQKTFELPDGAALILTVAKYASPSGKKLQDDAVTPGVLVASNFPNDNDDDLDEDAVEGTPAATPKKPAVTVDEQLTKALDLLKGKTA